LALASAAMLLAPMLLPQLLALLRSLLKGKKDQSGGRLAPEKLGKPPVALIEALLSGRSVLWTGAGLRAQSGCPTRAACVRSVLTAATVENWIKPADEGAVRRLWEQGDPEGAMARLKEKAVAPRELPALIAAMVSKYPALSKSHEMLAQIPFAAGLTTNYD